MRQNDSVLFVNLKSLKQLLQYCNDELCSHVVSSLGQGTELYIITILFATLLVINNVWLLIDYC